MKALTPISEGFKEAEASQKENEGEEPIEQKVQEARLD